jgi:hypothetical protein
VTFTVSLLWIFVKVNWPVTDVNIVWEGMLIVVWAIGSRVFLSTTIPLRRCAKAGSEKSAKQMAIGIFMLFITLVN